MNTITSLLTHKQKRFYETLKDYTEKYGRAPTIQELMRLLDFSSPRAVTQYLMALERKGLIKRARYEKRGIQLRDLESMQGSDTVTVPVIASAGCDNVSIMAQRIFDEYVCVAQELLAGKPKDAVVSIRAVGDSMKDAGISEGDYVLVEMTQAVSENDLVVAIIDSFAVIKKLELANNAVILKPVSTDPQYRPIILNRDFKIFGKVIDIVRRAQHVGEEIEIVPLVSSY